jgi:hypothetical protein
MRLAAARTPAAPSWFAPRLLARDADGRGARAFPGRRTRHRLTCIAPPRGARCATPCTCSPSTIALQLERSPRRTARRGAHRRVQVAASRRFRARVAAGAAARRARG